MRAGYFKSIAVVCAFTASLVFASFAGAAPAVNGIFPVKGVDTNSKIVAGPDGNMWITIGSLAGNNVARVTPAGEVKEFELGLSGTTGIAVGPEGRIWLTSAEAVTSFSPTDPVGTKKSTTINEVELVSPIVAGPDGDMWVASQQIVIKFPAANPATNQQFIVAELDPKDIDVAGSLLAVSDGGAKNRIETITTSGALGEIPIGGASQGLAGGPAGQLAFSVPGATPEQVGLVTLPDAPAFSELLGDPFGIALGVDQAYWIAQFTPGGLTRMTTSGVETFIPGLPKESPRQIAAGPGNTMWVTLSKNEEEGVARISGLEPPAPLAPSPAPISGPAPPIVKSPATKLGKHPGKVVKVYGPKAKVKFSFSSSTAGARFQCALLKVRKGKKATPRYRGCKSPKVYRLNSGRYRFAVRAVVGGVADPSPAKSSFKVVRLAIE